MEQNNKKIEIIIEVDQDVKDKIEVFQSKTGVTDDEILIYGIYKILKDLPQEEIFKYISLDNYEKILKDTEVILKKITGAYEHK